MKRFKLAASEIRDLAPGRGSCIATDSITVGGAPVGWMYREPPDNEIDSGWRFFSGSESQEEVDDPANLANFALYDVNTIANYDPDIIPHLDAAPGCAFERKDGVGPLVRAPFPRPD